MYFKFLLKKKALESLEIWTCTMVEKVEKEYNLLNFFLIYFVL